MNALQTRVIQWMFRSAAGRFFRRMGKDQFEGVKMSPTRVEFTSNDLELNEEVINAEVLANAQVRLVAGSINSMIGDFPLSTESTRRVVLDGVHLTLDFVNPANISASPTATNGPAGEAAVGDAKRAAHDHPPSHHAEQRLGSFGRLISVEDFYSSMVEDAKQVKRGGSGGAAASPAAPEPADPGLPTDIDQCAEALSNTFKALLHNTIGVLRDVNLRLRFPPPGCDIVPGQPLPANAVEVYIHIPRIAVTDATDMSTALNNSFRKRVRFSGIMVQVYDATTRVETEGAATLTTELDLNNTVLQGDPIDLHSDGAAPTLDDVIRLEKEAAAGRAAGVGGSSGGGENEECLNELDIELNDADPNRPIWRRRLSITQVHALLSPAQLLRVMRVAEYFSRAPDGGRDDEAAADPSAAPASAEDSGETKTRVVLSDVSLALLQTDAPDAVANVWHRFNVDHVDPQAELARLPHYAVRLSHFLLQTATPLDFCAPDPNEPDDPLLKLFNRVRGTELTIAVGGASVIERQPAESASTVVLRLDDAPPDMGKSFILTQRTSFTMSIERAKHYQCDVEPALERHAETNGIDLRDLRRSPQTLVAQQHVHVFMGTPLHVYADVEMLDRVLSFSRHLDELRARAHSAKAAAGDAATDLPSVTSPEGSLPSLQPLTEDALKSRRHPPAASNATESRATSGGPMFYSAKSQDDDPLLDSDDGSVGLENLGDMAARDDPESSSGGDEADLCESDSDQEAAAQQQARVDAERAKFAQRDGQRPSAAGHQQQALGGRKESVIFEEPTPSPLFIGPQTVVVSSIAVRCESLDLQLKFPVSRRPPPDLYGPDSVVLFDTLVKRSVTSSRFEEEDRVKAKSTTMRRVASYRPRAEQQLMARHQQQHGGELDDLLDCDVEDGHRRFLPRCLMLVCEGVSVDLPDADGSTIILTSERIGASFRQLDLGDSVTLLTASSLPSSYAASGSNGGATGHVSFAVPEPVPTGLASSNSTASGNAAAAAAPGLSGGSRKRVQFPTVRILRNAERLAPPLNIEQTQADLLSEEENQATQASLVADAAVSVDIKIPYLASEVLMRDHLLLIIFMATELSDCISGALDKDAESRNEAALKQMEKALRDSMKSSRKSAASDDSLTHFFTSKGSANAEGFRLPTTAVHLTVNHCAAGVRASRLDGEGRPLGQTLWTIVPPDMRDQTKLDCHFHRYRAQLHQFSLFTVMQSPSMTSSLMVLMIKARAIELAEILPRPLSGFVPPASASMSAPPWGHAVKLLESCASVYGRANDLSPERAAAKPPVFKFGLRREYNTRRRTDDMDMDIILDRFSMSHHPAHEGDHWIFVLMGFVSDTPVVPSDTPTPPSGVDSPPSGTERSTPPVVNSTFAEGSSQARRAATTAAANAAAAATAAAVQPPQPVLKPFTARSNVNVTVRESFLEYMPFSRSERVVLLVPELRVQTGDLYTGSPKMALQVFIDDPIAVMMHNKFFDRILQYDSNRGSRSVFGSTRRGLRDDLLALGFVPLATLKHKYATRAAARSDGGSSAMASQQSVHHMMASQRRFNMSTRFEVGPESIRVAEALHAHGGARASFKSSVHGGGGGAPAGGANATQSKLAAVRVLSAVYAEKPLVVDISGLELELSAAWDSFLRFRNVLQHFFAGVDATFLPSPRQFVGQSGPYFLHLLAGPHIPRPPPKKKDRAPHTATPPPQGPYAYVGGVPVRPDDLENGVDPLAALRNEAGDIARQQTEEVLDTFDVLPQDEAAYAAVKVSWVPRDQPITQRPEDRGHKLKGFVGSVDDLGFTELTIGGESHNWGHGFLTALFKNPKHFSRANTTFRRRDMDVPAKPLPHCPKPAVEIVLSDSSLRFVLCGGSDFAAEQRMDFEELQSDGWDAMVSTNFRAYEKPDGTRFIRSTRSEDEEVIAEFTGVFLQLDVFEPGHNMQQRLHVTAQDVSIIDKVRASPVRQLLWCDVPDVRRDRPVFELRWTSFAYSEDTREKEGLMATEEDMAVRAMPLHVSLSRVTLDMLAKFVDPPDAQSPLTSRGPPGSSPSPAASPESSPPPPETPMFFRRLTLHPVTLKFSWYPDLRDVSALAHGNVVELASIMTVEGSTVELSDIVIHACPANLVAEQLTQAIMPLLYTSKVIFLFAGLQPVRTAAELVGAMSELVVTPLEYHRNNKSLYNGIARGLSMCTRRLAGETLRVASGATRVAHEGVSWASSAAAPNAYADPMLRGNQPEGLYDGLSRGATEVARGVAGLRVALRNSIYEIPHDGRAVAKIPLSLLLPIDGAFRGLTEVLLGARNALQPERRREEVLEFKSTKFSAGKPKK